MADLKKTIRNISSTTQDVHTSVGNAVILSLSKAWIGIGLIRPAKTNPDDKFFNTPDWIKKRLNGTSDFETIESRTPTVDRFDYTKLYSLQIGEYFMPLSQTFTLRAKKRLNTSSLVDGIDIIQQTRKESKTIDCVLRITLRDTQENLHIVEDDAQASIIQLAQFLNEFYEADAVFEINNDFINNTFNVTHVFMSEYKFSPQVGRNSFTFEFSLTEIIYGENVLTFDLNQITSDNNGQITG